MESSKFCTVVVSLSLAAVLHAQNIAGTWQGTLKADKELRFVLQIDGDAQGG